MNRGERWGAQGPESPHVSRQGGRAPLSPDYKLLVKNHEEINELSIICRPLLVITSVPLNEKKANEFLFTLSASNA